MGGLVVPRRQLLATLAADEREQVSRCLDHAHLRMSRAERLHGGREFLHGIFDLLGSAPRLLDNAPMRQSLRHATLSNLAELLLDDCPPEAREIPPSHRWQIVAAARAHVLAHPEQPLTVADLCRATGTSRRTLQYSFQAVLNVNPNAFLRSMRLNGVRRMLREAASVSDAATHWGFWHFGHFARDYRALFGERPSDTHRRHRHGTLTH